MSVPSDSLKPFSACPSPYVSLDAQPTSGGIDSDSQSLDFAGTSSLPNLQGSTHEWTGTLPCLNEVQILCQLYFIAVHPLQQVIHKPLFELERQSLFVHGEAGLNAYPPSFRALKLAICLSARTSVSATEVEMRLGLQKHIHLAELRAATVQALEEADYLESIDLHTLQAFTIYLVSHPLP